MAKLSAAEIEQHYKDNSVGQDVESDLYFEPPHHDECIEEPYDYAQDDWLFDDFHDSIYDDRYDDPYPCDDDYYF
jgi:hypothetical protein